MTSQETLRKNAVEFSRPFNLENVGYAGPYRLQLTANETECADLAKRFNLDSIQSLNAEWMITRGEGRRKGIKAEAQVHAEVSQQSDHPSVSYPLNFQIKLNLMEGDEDTDTTTIDWEAELASEYDCEFYQNSQVDFGEIVAQYLSLEVMPLSLLEHIEEDVFLESDKKVSPFAVLEKIKR